MDFALNGHKITDLKFKTVGMLITEYKMAGKKRMRRCIRVLGSAAKKYWSYIKCVKWQLDEY